MGDFWRIHYEVITRSNRSTCTGVKCFSQTAKPRLIWKLPPTWRKYSSKNLEFVL